MSKNKLSLARGLDRLFGRVAQWCALHTVVVSLFLVVLAGTGGYFATSVHIDNGLDSLFNEEDPVYDFYQAYQREFYPDETIYLLYEAPGTSYGPFDIGVMKKIALLTQALEREIPFVRKVTSLANAEFVEATDDLIEIHDLAFDFPGSQADLLALRDIVLAKPMFVNNLISEDAQFGAIVVDMTKTIAMPIASLRLDPDGGDAMENLYPQVAEAALREILDRPEFAGIKFYASGDVAYNAFYNRVTFNETPIIALGTFILIALIGALVFPHGLVGLGAPLAVVLLAITLTIGFIGWRGWSLGFMFTMIPAFICAVGVSQAVHVMLAFQRARESTEQISDAARIAIEEVGAPCFLAALTTAIGLLGMTVSSIEAIAQMAVYAAFGVLASFVLSITIMISISALVGRRQRPPAVKRKLLPRAIDNAMAWIGQLISSHPRNVLIVCGVAIAGSAVGVSRLQVDYNFIEELKPHLEIRRSIEKAEAVMGGFVSVVYIFDTDREDGIRNLELVQLIDEFSQYAEQQPLVRKAQSVAEITKDLNQALHGDDPAWYRLPDDSDTLAQLLFLYQLSGGEEINDYINFDSSQTVVQLRVTVSDASEIRELLNDLSAFLAARTIDGIEVKTTGMGLLWTSIADYIAASQLHGYSAVFILIFIFILITYRSFSISVYAMIANVAPILFILGFMGASGMKLDYMRLLLATIAIGIAVDDTIHLLHRYQLEFELVRDYRIALRRALSNVGPALVTTTIILVVSFLTYLYSDIAVLASFGVLLSAAVFFALLADLFLLPAMILTFKPFGPERKAA